MRVYCRAKPPFEEMSEAERESFSPETFDYNSLQRKMLKFPQLLRD